MNISVVTSLFPSPPRPREGIFALRRWTAFVGLGSGHEVRIVHPVPFAPFVRGERAEYRDMPAEEIREGLSVVRPRYLHVPRQDRANARRFARAAWRAILRHRDTGFPSEAIVCDYAWPAAELVPRAVELGVPTLVSARGSDVLAVSEDARLAPRLTKCLACADALCAVSRHLADRVDELVGRKGACRLIANGVDVDLFHPGPKDAARAGLGLGAGALVLVVGHLIPRKDPLLALEAFRRGAPPDARLVFLGRGELEAELRAAIVRDGLADRVELRGEVDPEQLADWYRAADLLLLTSRREGRPNVVLEALASGLPVVATRAGGTAELLADTPEGLASDAAPEEIAGRVRAVLADPPDPERCLAAVAQNGWRESALALEGLLRSLGGLLSTS